MWCDLVYKEVDKYYILWCRCALRDVPRTITLILLFSTFVYSCIVLFGYFSANANAMTSWSLTRVFMRSIGLPVCCSIKSGQYLTGPIDHRHYLVYKMWLVKKKIYVHCNYTIYIIELKRIHYSRFYQLLATGPNLFFYIILEF